MRISTVNLLLSSAYNEFRVRAEGLHTFHEHGYGDVDDNDDDDDDVTRSVYLATFRVINRGFINDS